MDLEYSVPLDGQFVQSLNSVVTNYEVLLQLWEDCLETRLQSDIRARIIGVQSQMESYK